MVLRGVGYLGFDSSNARRISGLRRTSIDHIPRGRPTMQQIVKQGSITRTLADNALFRLDSDHIETAPKTMYTLITSAMKHPIIPSFLSTSRSYSSSSYSNRILSEGRFPFSSTSDSPRSSRKTERNWSGKAIQTKSTRKNAGRLTFLRVSSLVSGAFSMLRGA